MSNEKRQLISKHIEGWKGSLQNASIEYFAEQGKVSGSLLCALEKMMQEYSDQQTALLQSRIKELEETKRAYQECFELYMPDNKKDEATLFLSTFNNGLAKDMANKQR